MNEYKDLTKLNTFTVDGESTKDLDDAISVDIDRKIVYTHIAFPNISDITIQRRLDEKRYFTKYHFYKGIKESLFFNEQDFSLNEGEERDSITLEYHVESGEYFFYKAKVINKEKLTYKNIKEKRRKDYDFLLEFHNLLKRNRLDFQNNGIGLEIDIPQLEVIDEENYIFRKSLESEKVVAELMLFFNNMFSYEYGDENLIFIENDTDPSLLKSREIDNTKDFILSSSQFGKTQYTKEKDSSHNIIGYEGQTQCTSPIRRLGDLYNLYQVFGSEEQREVFEGFSLEDYQENLKKDRKEQKEEEKAYLNKFLDSEDSVHFGIVSNSIESGSFVRFGSNYEFSGYLPGVILDTGIEKLVRISLIDTKGVVIELS